MTFDHDEAHFLQQLGGRIRQLRKAKGWSQEELGRAWVACTATCTIVHGHGSIKKHDSGSGS